MADVPLSYLPTDLMDEVIPTPRASPDDWIVTGPDGAAMLAQGADDDDADPAPLTDWEAVWFSVHHDYGTATLIVSEDGSWTVDREPPDGVTHICALMGWQAETISTSVADCARCLREAGAGAGEATLAYSHWSSEWYIFDPTTRRFIRGDPDGAH